MTQSDWPTGMMVIQGNHLEELRDVMTGWIRRYPLSPLEDEQILVQSNGIAQWLKMALAEDEDKGGCGIAAAMNVQLPGRFIWQAYRCFEPDIPGRSPFDKGPLTWTLYQLLSDQNTLQERIPNSECLSPLLGFLKKDADPRRTYQLAAKLSDMYDQYQIYRADWLTAWEEGQDILIRVGQEPNHIPLADEQLWQPALWRLLSQTILERPLDAALDEEERFWAKKSRSDIHRIIVEQCQQLNEAPEDLPKRVIVFGISALPQQTLELLQGLSRFSQVLLFVHNPSPHYWGDLIEGRSLLKQYTRTTARKLPEGLPLESLNLQGNPLLASWGKQGRDYLHLLDENDQPDAYRDHFSSIDLFEPPDPDETGGMPLLRQIQADIFELRSLDERQRLSALPEHQIDADRDNSLQFLIAHSPQREIEILHDQLLDAFEQAQKRGESLQPRDILVMVPDVAVYAPHVQAVFGRYLQSQTGSANEYSPRDPRYIPFHISDQGQRGINSLLTAFESLLHLRDARFAVSELLDLLDTPALQLRFGLTEEQLPKLHQWIKGANIRWGLDHQHRAELDLAEAGEQNSWLFGLRRMLLGYAVGQHDRWQGIEPYDEIAGLEASLIGPLVLLIDALQLSREVMMTPRTPRDWERVINELCHRFFTTQEPADERALSTISKGLDSWCQECELGQLTDDLLPLEVLREELLSRIDQPTLTQKFLGGSVNFATLMPMRAIPFKQVWLLGMNDADYPRSQQAADFDLMANDYRPGDRSRREDDRYLFLEALLSARERLVISWVGRNIRDNSAKPPSVLVGQLRDYIAAGWRLAGDETCTKNGQKGDTLLKAITTEHPLQPFSIRYFLAPDGDRSAHFTYAKEWRDVHDESLISQANHQASELLTDLALIRGEKQLPPFDLDAPLSLNDLAEFLRHPVKTFFSRRLGVRWFDEGEMAEDEEIFALDGLSRWALQKTLIERVIQQQSEYPEESADNLLDVALARIQAAGDLPMAGFAESEQIRLKDALYEPLSLHQMLQQKFPHPHVSRIRSFGLSTGDQLEAQLNDLWQDDQGRTIRLILQPSRLLQGDDLKYYHLIRHWPAHLFAQLDQPVTTHLLGADSQQPIQMQPLPPEQAESLLTDLAEAWLENINQLWPLACKTAFSYLTDGDPAGEYLGGFNRSGEIDDHPAYSRFWQDFEALTDDGRFDQLAERLYGPMLACLKPPQPIEDPQGNDGSDESTNNSTIQLYSSQGGEA